MGYDMIIENGLLVDGTGTPGTHDSVGITGNKITAIGDLTTAETARRIDALGHVVSPGFIDTHAHADGALLIDGQHAEGVRQGITTELVGPDGLTYAPLPHDMYLMYRQYLSGLLGLPPKEEAFKRLKLEANPTEAMKQLKDRAATRGLNEKRLSATLNTHFSS